MLFSLSRPIYRKWRSGEKFFLPLKNCRHPTPRHFFQNSICHLPLCHFFCLAIFPHFSISPTSDLITEKPQSRKLNSLRLFLVGTDPPTFFIYPPCGFWGFCGFSVFHFLRHFCCPLTPDIIFISPPCGFWGFFTFFIFPQLLLIYPHFHIFIYYIHLIL